MYTTKQMLYMQIFSLSKSVNLLKVRWIWAIALRQPTLLSSMLLSNQNRRTVCIIFLYIDLSSLSICYVDIFDSKILKIILLKARPTCVLSYIVSTIFLYFSLFHRSCFFFVISNSLQLLSKRVKRRKER